MGQGTALLVITLILIIYWVWRLTQAWLLRTLPSLEWATPESLLQMVMRLGEPALLTTKRGGTAVWGRCLFPKVVLNDGEGRTLSACIPLHYHYGRSSLIEVGPAAQASYVQRLKKRGDAALGPRGATIHCQTWEELLQKTSDVIALLESGVGEHSPPPRETTRAEKLQRIEEYLVTSNV